MAFKDRYGITQIIDSDINNLSINWDSDRGSRSKMYPVLLFIPNMNNTDIHYHVQLNRIQAKKLQKWLQDFLEGKETKK